MQDWKSKLLSNLETPFSVLTHKSLLLSKYNDPTELFGNPSAVV
jgi:hypothetical protein